MAVSGIGDRLHLTQPGFRQKLIRTLVPLNNGPNEIRALDGLRATAALSVLALHFLSFVNFQLTPLGSATAAFWQYLGTGVELFFVLSGFLLFLPYARAMLHSKPLPSVRGFYRRRAL